MTEPFDDLRRYADDLAAEVSPYTAQRAVRAGMAPRQRRPRKAIVALVATGLLGVSNVALAATADSAVPGDALYGVDRGYERVADLLGLGGPRVAERMQETGILIERGQVGMALDLVQETLTKVLDSDDPQAEFDTLVENATGMPEVVNHLVGVAHLISTDDDVTGQDVAELARQLGEHLARERSNRPDHAGPPEDSPAATAPGQTGETPANPSQGGGQP